ncbi:elongation factor P--(R)-beta-lysine ligase [Psychrosphaera haliotis]|uniref:elongation factor P--(R)-beta-lysine ligase n=1 Tax=Psychrosphaera haliotis TaxID=555083 RepID=UPI00236E242C|nr:elongation factor P--(R)-beta-lysine ligase [Psychrosphaera haliotis]
MNNSTLWQPSSNIETLKQRAAFISDIRHFFASRHVVEVETPLLSQGTVTDVHLDAFDTNFEHDTSGENKTLYLQTSPEFAMKRLLCAGSGPIFQIAKAFRNESAGRFHNPEFTMLEWYRPDFDEHQLMDELDDLLQHLLKCERGLRVSYQQVFLDNLGIDPLQASLKELKAAVLSHSPSDDWVETETSKDTLLQWLFSIRIEPVLGFDPNSKSWQPCFVYDFPSSQAALAKVNSENEQVSHRFELYFKGIELANGYFELQSEVEQLQRFEKDNQQRLSIHKAAKPIDHNLIDALTVGLPSCAGVAVGIDRLFMLKVGAKSIADVISFDVSRC